LTETDAAVYPIFDLAATPVTVTLARKPPTNRRRRWESAATSGQIGKLPLWAHCWKRGDEV